MGEAANGRGVGGARRNSGDIQGRADRVPRRLADGQALSRSM
jgi:hypothetical protein